MAPAAPDARKSEQRNLLKIRISLFGIYNKYNVVALDALDFLIRLIRVNRHLTDARCIFDVLRHDVLY